MSRHRRGSGITACAAALEDALAVVAVRNASRRFDFGAGTLDEEELLAQWQAPEFDLKDAAWVAATQTGEIIAYGQADPNKDGTEIWTLVAVVPEHRGFGIEGEMLRLAERYVAKRMEGETDQSKVQPPVTLFAHINKQNDAARQAYEEAGFTPYLSFQIMQIDLTEPPPQPQWPKAITVRTFVRGQDEQQTYEADRGFCR